MGIQLPQKPADFTQTKFEPRAPGVALKQIVRQFTAGADMSVSARIAAGGTSFHSLSIDVFTLELQTIDPSELPHKPGQPATPVKVWAMAPAGSSKGAPITVSKGEVVEVSVILDIAQGTPAGAVAGTLAIQVDAGPEQSLALTGTCLAADAGTPIGRKYVAVGGARVLGNALDLPQAVPGGTGEMQRFELGALWQVAATEVFLVAAPILAKWADRSVAQTKTAAGDTVQHTLGKPIEDSFATAEHGTAQRFKGGMIVARPGNRAVVIYGAIWGCYQGLGDVRVAGRMPVVGWPTGDETINGLGGRVSPCDAGEVHWSAATGAHEVHGAILARWKTASLAGDLGMPMSNELVAADGVGRFSRFQRGIIAWVPRFGAFEVPGALAAWWTGARAMNGWLGYPTAVTHGDSLPALPRAQTHVRFQYGSAFLLPRDEVVVLPDEKTFTQQVLTPSGTALGGTVTLTVRSDGTWDFKCHMRDSGAEDYTFAVRVLLTTASGVALALQANGSVEGHIIGDAGRSFDHEESNAISDPAQAADIQVKQQIQFLQDHWPDIAEAQFSVAHSYQDTGLLGSIEDALQDLATWVVGAAVGGPALATIVLLGSALGKHLGVRPFGPGGLVGVVIAGASVLILGPIGFTAAAVVGGVVGNIAIKHRTISDDEYAFANRIFKGQLPPQSQIILTNLAQPGGNADGGRKFTVPNIDGSILVNLGDACFADPIRYKGTVNYTTPGQVFIHELTHAWQIYHRSTLGVLCDVVTKRRANVDADIYAYGTPDTPFGDFGLEQQAHIVDDWFGGTRPDDHGHTSNSGHREDFQDPFFHYISDNIWLGNPG